MLFIVDITVLESLLKTEVFWCSVLYIKKEVSTEKFPIEKERHAKSKKWGRQGEQVYLPQVINNSAKHPSLGLVLYQILDHTILWFTKGYGCKSIVSSCSSVVHNSFRPGRLVFFLMRIIWFIFRKYWLPLLHGPYSINKDFL